MVSVAPVMELLEKFLNSEYRDLYSVGGMSLGLALSWARKNVSWTPQYLFKNTRKAWQTMEGAEGDAVIRVLCCTAPCIADTLLAIFHVLYGFGRKADTSQVVRSIHDSLLNHDSSYQEELHLLRKQLDQAKRDLGTSLAEVREKVLIELPIEQSVVDEKFETAHYKICELSTKLEELESVYCVGLDESAAKAVERLVRNWTPPDVRKLGKQLSALDTNTPLKDPASVDEAIGLYKRMLDDEADDRSVC